LIFINFIILNNTLINNNNNNLDLNSNFNLNNYFKKCNQLLKDLNKNQENINIKNIILFLFN
jgi:hypothetical protein